MKDFSIIIPHRGNAMGLWATIQSCDEDLIGTPLDYSYVIVTNGGANDPDTEQTIGMVERTGRLGKHLHFDEPVSPPVARQRGAAVADGELLVFFDNHCLVGRRYFERAAAQFRAHPIDMLHSAYKFYTGDGTHYHYRLKLDFNFWAESSKLADHELSPYKLAAGGHGGFLVRKTVWDEVGGYGPEDMLRGYGGEEMLLDLKLWRYGKNNWIDPKLVHHHYAGNRGYQRHYTDDYYVNLMVSAMVIGGEPWLYKVYESFASGKHLRLRPESNMYDLMQRAYGRSAEHSRLVDAKSVRSLDEALVYFRENQVAYT